ncbi:cytochrome P450 [Streptomyces capparidis]
MTTVTLPPGPRTPRWAQGAYALAVPWHGLPRLREHYGDAFTVNVPVFGRAVVISAPEQIRQLFQAGTDVADNLEPNLGRVLGPASLFALDGEEHRRRRRLLVPPFHGRRLAAYERIVEEETARELATWPQGRPFATLPSMMRVTLDVILRAVFGARGEQSARLRALLPPLVGLGSRLAVLPFPRLARGRWSPWERFRAMRRDYDAAVARLIDAAQGSGDLDGRDDVLALLLQSRYDDGSPMSRAEVADHLLTLLAAGHETTATTLAWAVERLRRHPAVLRDLAAEADRGGTALREAVIREVQRTRPVVDIVGRRVTAERLRLGPWTLPRGCTVLVSIGLVHADERLFPRAGAFDPTRFTDAKPDLYQWIPYGGGIRRCLGAAFAHMEMDVVLRTLLREVTLLPTAAPGERWRFRGVANAPARGGRAVVRRRTPLPAPSAGAGPTGARP